MSTEPRSDSDPEQALYQRLLGFFPDLCLEPLPDFPNDGGIPDGHRLPADYKSWIRRIGHGPLDEDGFRLYAGPQLGRNVIPNHRRLGLSDVVVVAGDGDHHFVLYNTRYSPWYIHVVVGELGLMSALEPSMTFSDYIAYITRDPRSSQQGTAGYTFLLQFLHWHTILFGVLGLILAFLAYYAYDIIRAG